MNIGTIENKMERKKILYILNKANRVNNFSYTSMLAAKNIDFDFHIAGNWSYESDEERIKDEEKYNIKIHQVDFIRAPYHPGNLKAYKQLVKIIKEEKIDYIHCNTPIGGVLGRLAGKKCKVKKVIYQVHGFHFYKGAPKLNWLLYYPIEKWLARYTDALITINKEDFEFATKKIKLRKNGKVYYVPGVGIDSESFSADDCIREKKRNELNIPLDAFVLISVGELNKNKNNGVIISALGKAKNNKIHYVLCGFGELEREFRKQAEKAGLVNNVHFLGYRKDVKELYKMSDCFVMPSYREGLSRSIMEAMSSGLPCIVSKIRGNVDLVNQDNGGYLVKAEDIDGFASAINSLCNDELLCEKMSEYNKKKIKEFDVSVVTKEIIDCYKEVFEI